MDYKALQANATKTLQEKGVMFKLVRNGSEVAKFYGIFTTSNYNDLDAKKYTPISGAVSSERYILAEGAMKTVPAVSDVVTRGTHTFTVVELEAVQPGDIPILFKLRLK
jgi:hypothetical protein